MSGISQREFAFQLLRRGWQCITYVWDVERRSLEYMSIADSRFEKWWSDKGNKVWFRHPAVADLKIKFDYEQIMVWPDGENPEIFFKFIPTDTADKILANTWTPRK